MSHMRDVAGTRTASSNIASAMAAANTLDGAAGGHWRPQAGPDSKQRLDGEQEQGAPGQAEHRERWRKDDSRDRGKGRDKDNWHNDKVDGTSVDCGSARLEAPHMLSSAASEGEGSRPQPTPAADELKCMKHFDNGGERKSDPCDDQDQVHEVRLRHIGELLG
mmetsp:Transcript_19082/g.41134  ORF Transcript_19082/g.41134 Transcript_19082/m.41134 type:complete len:163 (+) Transcript_19082:1562-2050(+)